MLVRKIHIAIVVMAFISLFPDYIQAAGIEYITTVGGKIKGTAIHQNHAYLAQGDKIKVFDFQDTEHIDEIGCFHAIDKSEPLEIGQIGIRWPVIYYVWSPIGSYYHHLGIIDISNPSRMVKIGDLGQSTKGYMGFVIQDSFLVTSCIDSDTNTTISNSGFIYDISNPQEPKRIFDESTVIDKLGEVMVINRATLPQSIKNHVFAGSIHRVGIDGHTLYVIDNEKSAKTIDITNPEQPKYLGVAKDVPEKIKKQFQRNAFKKLDKPIVRGNIRIRKKYYPEPQVDRVFVEDVSNPASPKIISKLLTDQNAVCLLDVYSFFDNLLFLVVYSRDTAGTTRTLVIYDLKDPKKPRQLGKYPDILRGVRGVLGATPGGIAVSDNMIYVADEGDGLIILRMTGQKNIGEPQK